MPRQCLAGRHSHPSRQTVKVVSPLAKIRRSPQAEGRFRASILQHIFAIAGGILRRPDVKSAEEMPR